jgi:DNA-binding response OmpR family regulator
MVTSRSKDSDIVQALEAGADDYITKPIAPPVMLARVSALLRRTYHGSAVAQEREVHCGVTFDHADCAVEIGGRREILTAKEFRLALLLFQNIDRPMSRAHLLESVWGRNPDLLTRTLDVHVSRLRARLGLRPGSGFKLSPVHSFGYRLETVASRPALKGGVR